MVIKIIMVTELSAVQFAILNVTTKSNERPAYDCKIARHEVQ